MRHRALLSLSIAIFGALLFAGLFPTIANASHARIVRLSLVQGDVRFARDVHGDSLSDDKAVWEGAVLNLPIRQGYAIATDSGRAEIEFENGAMAFLGENSVLEFYDLSLEDGAKTTRLILRQGTGSFYVHPESNDFFSVTGGDFSVSADGRASFRVDNFDDGSVVKVLGGRVSVLGKEKTTALEKGQSLSMRAGDVKSVNVDRLPDDDDFDRWVSGREDRVVTATVAAQQYVNSPTYTSGFADLYTYGGWYPVSGYGNCWRPYGVGFGWSPFDNGGWYTDPVFGASFIGYQPWGWLPYHYGGWIFDPGIGWLWAPTGFGYGGFLPWSPVTGRWVRSGTGLLGIVPTHPLDAHSKTPVNLAHGVFPINGGALQGATVNTSESWKTIKAPPRETVSSSLAASPAPSRVSRTVFTGNTGSRVVTLDRQSSITYDPREHRFVNANTSPAEVTQKPSADDTNSAKGIPVGERSRVQQAGGNSTSHNAAGSSTQRAALPPASPRNIAPPNTSRSMTPPPSPRSAEGRTGSAGSSWGSFPSHGAAPAPHAAPPAASGGHPH